MTRRVLTALTVVCRCTGSVCVNTTQPAATVSTVLPRTTTGPGRRPTAEPGLRTSAEVSINLHDSKAFFVDSPYLWMPRYLLTHNTEWWVTEARHRHTHIATRHARLQPSETSWFVKRPIGPRGQECAVCLDPCRT